MPAHATGVLFSQATSAHTSSHILLTVLILALIIDRLFGDPQDRYHTTAYMGKMIDFLKSRAPLPAPRSHDSRHFHLLRHSASRTFYGVFIFFAVTLSFSSLAYLILEIIPYPLSPVIGAVILKLQFSWRGLADFTKPIETCLKNGDLPGARTRLASVVGRDVTALDEEHVASAAVETIGENSVDGIISPLFYFAVLGITIDWRLGVTAAVFYRAANTLDSMVGYKNQEYRELGQFSARADDLLNFIPARLASLLIITSSFFLKKDGKNAIRIVWKDRSKTQSPNSGHPIAAVAGAVGIQVEKMDFYRIGEGKNPDPAHINTSLWIVDGAVTLFIVIIFISVLVVMVVR